MTVAAAKGAKAKCDRLFSLIVRAEGACQAAGYPLASGYCATACPCPDFPRSHTAGCRLQCCHIVTRARSWTRTYELNALCLCAAHHAYFTANPVEWGRWVTGWIGENAYAEVLERSRRTDKFDWSGELERLTARAKEIGIR